MVQNRFSYPCKLVHNRFSIFQNGAESIFRFFQMAQNRFSIFPNSAESIMVPLKVGENRFLGLLKV